MQHFIEHDVIHGIWHVDRGILRTVKDLFTRPGHSVRAFVLGKRANYFNFITLLLTLLAISAIVVSYAHFDMMDMMPEASRKSMNSFQKFATKYPKVMLLITIPFYSLFSYVWFKKAKFNLSEHLVLNSYKTAAELIIGIVFTAVTIFYTDKSGLMILYSVVVYLGSLSYTMWFYYQFFSKSGFSKSALFWRSLMVPLSYMMLSVVFGIIYGFFSAMAK
ncbi:MAG: DUF3667 domain-containing protein [Bacteroidota bacterium]